MLHLPLAVALTAASAVPACACEDETPTPSPTEPAPAAEPAPPRPAEPTPPDPAAGPTGAELDTAGWQTILSTYVTDDGGFRYQALHDNAEHRALLDAFVASLDTARPDDWGRDVQLAFYINAYNALTVKSVIDLWPLESVMSAHGFFDERKHHVAGRELTLNQLEGDIIRSDRFAEPRIHFAVNCASAGCPPLAARAYSAATLDASLTEQTRAFVRASTQVRPREILASQIFEWYAADFARAGGVRAFIARYLDEADAATVRNESVRLGYRQYDWTLNGRN